MIGRHPGHITNQAQVLSDLLETSGYPVISTSAMLNRYMRLADIVRTITDQRDNIDVTVIEVYGGPSFVVEDTASWLGRTFGHRIAFYPHRQRTVAKPRLFWMRNFHRVWNPEMAVRTLYRLSDSSPDATLVMAGPDKGTRADVERLARELRVRDRVRFTGFLDRQGKILEAQAADVFINTNRTDNMPVAVIEAMAFGLPVVSTAVGGLTDFLEDGETVLFVPDDDDEAMSHAIARLLNNPELTARLSANGRKLAERSSWDRVHPEWEEVFARLVGGGLCERSSSDRATSDREIATALARADSGSVETF
jgi:glycosyltransferase involved in cell wall biosynthesis